MIANKNFLQVNRHLQSHCPVAKRLTVSVAQILTVTFFAPTVITLTAHQLNAQTITCASSYEPGAPLQRSQSGLFDGRIGPIKVTNNTETAAVISLYHPDAPQRIFKYWYAEPGQSYFLGTDSYSSDWGIQMDEGPVCIVGRVATWDGRTFTTFPSRLFITDAPPATRSVASKSQTSVTLTPPLPQPPETYEAIASKQITHGDTRNGLISLFRAADLYRASGRAKEERRVRERIKQLCDPGKASASRL
jgi:hypothetical protein